MADIHITSLCCSLDRPHEIDINQLHGRARLVISWGAPSAGSHRRVRPCSLKGCPRSRPRCRLSCGVTPFCGISCGLSLCHRSARTCVEGPWWALVSCVLCLSPRVRIGTTKRKLSCLHCSGCTMMSFISRREFPFRWRSSCSCLGEGGEIAP